jgi:23S rRNA pseudouridine1911/1915/1917 synthase
MGHPIVADQKYGGGENRTKGFLPEVTKELGQVLTILERHALHAMGLEFVHPETAKTVSLQAPLPDNINRAIKLLNEKYG